MCTVTVVPGDGMVRLACNRDESHSRVTALPPRVQRFGDCQAILPIDPVSAGTWVAVNDAGLAMTLLNVNREYRPARSDRCPQSRGMIIPRLLRHDSLSSATRAALDLDPTRFAPFRLVLADRRDLAEIYSDGKGLWLSWRLEGPHFFTSSGLGDEMVDGVRRDLFHEHFHQPGDWLARQEAFHRHRWPDQPQLSVCMHREDARTVSYTLVTIEPDRVMLTYHPNAPDRMADRITLSLPLTVGVAS